MKKVLTGRFIHDKLKMKFIQNKPHKTRDKARRDNMIEIELGEVQARFADIVWENEPVGSGELVKICADKLGWKKPTTYTVLRKLCEKGLFKNENGTVTSVISRDDFYSAKSERFVEETFDGSLPAFIAAFTFRKKPGKKEIEEIQKMIDSFRKEG